MIAALKSTVAALLAWWLADRIVGSPQSFLAPYTALFMIGVTVRASGSAAVRQVAIVTVGVTVAAVATVLMPTMPAIAATVAVGTVIGRAKFFSPDGTWIAITALVVLLYGTATDETMILYRIGDVALGAVVGLVVNAIVVPPEFLSEARDLIVERARGQANLLRGLAGAVDDGDADGRELRTSLWGLLESTGVTAAVDRGTDSLRGNIRRFGWTRVGGDRIYRPVASALDRTLISLSSLVVGVEELTRRLPDGGDGLRGDVSDLLTTLADALDELGYDPARHHSPYERMINEQLPEAMRLSDVVREEAVDAGPDAHAASTIVLGADSIAAALYELGDGRRHIG